MNLINGFQEIIILALKIKFQDGDTSNNLDKIIEICEGFIDFFGEEPSTPAEAAE